MTEYVTAQDGLPARVVGRWSEEKLYYVARYVDIFTTGMKDRWPRRVYIDLFSGPGICVLDDSGQEIKGSPLVALSARYPFTAAYLNDLDRLATEALRSRLAPVRDVDITIANLDCNAAAREAGKVLPLDASDTLGLAVVDPTAFQISLESLAAMTRERKIDLIITLMTGHLRRFIAEPAFEPALDPFFGSSKWRSLVDLRASGARITYRRLLDFYEDQLRSIGYTHVDDDARILNTRGRTIYHLVFATKNERGADFFKKISQRRFSGQRKMF
jgi:three-Cys-motif partner protein